jgi:hypothetical protein
MVAPGPRDRGGAVKVVEERKNKNMGSDSVAGDRKSLAVKHYDI